MVTRVGALALAAGGVAWCVTMFGEVATWLAERVGTTVVRSPGGHGAHFSHPVELAAFIASQDSSR